MTAKFDDPWGKFSTAMCSLARSAPVLATLLLATPAMAEGSVSFDEVMDFAAQNRTLMKEIKSSISEQHVKRNDIRCGAARFGNQWTYLGGDRAPPFTCQIGQRLLTINGDTHFFDINGRLILGGMQDPRVFREAHSFKATKLTWNWQIAN